MKPEQIKKHEDHLAESSIRAFYTVSRAGYADLIATAKEVERLKADYFSKTSDYFLNVAALDNALVEVDRLKAERDELINTLTFIDHGINSSYIKNAIAKVQK
jgi:hypothetical protein